jgi:hypothetical protein
MSRIATYFSGRSSRLVLASILAGAAVVALATSHVWAAKVTTTPGVVAPNKKTAGASYAEWGNRWWQWFDSIPASVHPFPDTTGVNCAQNQSGPVWYLAGSPDLDDDVVRSCTVPAGKYIFFPLANGQEDEREAVPDSAFFGSPDCPGALGADTCDQLYDILNPINTNHMRQLVDFIYTDVFDLLADPSVTGLFATVDDTSVADIGAYRFDSGGGGYTINLPPSSVPDGDGLYDNYHKLFGYSVPGPDTYLGAQVGYYVMLEPLSVGEHTVSLGRPGWTVTYHLTIP